MRFMQWVEKVGGVGKAAELIGVSQPAVSAWLRGANGMNRKTMIKVVALSKGKLKLENLIDIKR